ncbi:hypothetical protein [Corynebacterium sp. HMSC28B08]|uniref:hypothetical protein n=1 Tax=Corynebacterium sp. HMSC28B08 TaxID=1581066 RepID=UPI0008A41907|nr:hypothetical protein [Corynebacterium sp. HMSC28B08]OFT86839.1 hypothetical protein HMPREF3098_10635 [Corynebacterium sp. HMSC28B08]
MIHDGNPLYEPNSNMHDDAAQPVDLDPFDPNLSVRDLDPFDPNLSVHDLITAYNISIGYPHTTVAGWRRGVEAKEKHRPTPSSPLRVEMWWPFDRPDPTEREIARLTSFLTSNNLQLIAMNLWAGDMAAGERGVLHREPLPASHIDAVARIHDLTGVSKFNLLVGRRGEDADSWQVQCERFARAVVDVYRATGGKVLVENMSGIEDYPIKRVREAFELTWKVSSFLDDRARDESGFDWVDDDSIEQVESEGVGVLLDIYHFLTNWEAGIETNDPWDGFCSHHHGVATEAECGHSVSFSDEHEPTDGAAGRLGDEGDEIGEAGESNETGEAGESERAGERVGEAGEADEGSAHCATRDVGPGEIGNSLFYFAGCMGFSHEVSHVQVATWPDRSEPRSDDYQILSILNGLSPRANRVGGPVVLDIVGEWLPSSD